MASASITTVDGITIITQVIPRHDSSVTVQTPPTTAPEAPPPDAKVIPRDDSSVTVQTPPTTAPEAPPTDAKVIPRDDSFVTVQTPPTTALQAPPTPTKMNSKAAVFLRGEPQWFGVVQIFIGLLTVLFSLISVYSPALVLYAPLGLAGIFLVSGSLAMAAGRRTSVRLVWVSLVSNAFSALLGLVGVAYLCWLLAIGPPSQMFCSLQLRAEVSNLEEWRQKCADKLWFLDSTLYGLLGLHLVLLVLHTCAAAVVCVFCGKFIRRYEPYSPVTVGGDDASALLSSDDGLTGST